MSYQLSEVGLEEYSTANIKNRRFLHIYNYRALEAMSQTEEQHTNFVTAESATG